MAVGGVGTLLAARRPDNAIGWLLLGIALLISAVFVGDQYAVHALVTRPGWLPGGTWAAWVSDGGLWLPAIGSLLTFIPLLFPDGRLPTRRWRLPAWAMGAFLLVGTVIYAIDPELEFGSPPRSVANPIGVPGLRGVVAWLDGPGIVLFLGLAIASLASLMLRFRRSGAEERAQIKWFLLSIAFLVLYFVVQTVFLVAGVEEFGDYGLSQLWVFFAVLSVPVAMAFAVLKYRLYDIDVVINKAVLFAMLAVLVSAVYVSIVVGIGALIGSRGNLALSILATAVIAVAFQPVRERARHLANRLVYGKRATPYEVMSEFADRMANTYATEDVLPRMARILGEGTGASRAAVWLRLGAELHLAAAWPDEGAGPAQNVTVPPGGGLPDLSDVSAAVPVRHRSDLLGALTVSKPPGEPLTPAEEKLVSDLASQAGLVLRNVRLIEELRASRQRLVAAQDQERRRLERDLHDGAQQQLVALAMKLGLAGRFVDGNPNRAKATLEELQREAREALENLRDLARGIYPPLLADQGLVAALEAQARKAPLGVEVEADGVGRYPQEAEARVLLRPGGSPERGQVRPRRSRDHPTRPRRRRAHVRGERRRPGIRSGRHRPGDGPHQHDRQGGGSGRHPGSHVDAGQGNHRGRPDPRPDVAPQRVR
jgi:signal transduction histidine kinase